MTRYFESRTRTLKEVIRIASCTARLERLLSRDQSEPVTMAVVHKGVVVGKVVNHADERASIFYATSKALTSNPEFYRISARRVFGRMLELPRGGEKRSACLEAMQSMARLHAKRNAGI